MYALLLILPNLSYHLLSRAIVLQSMSLNCSLPSKNGNDNIKLLQVGVFDGSSSRRLPERGVSKFSGGCWNVAQTVAVA